LERTKNFGGNCPQCPPWLRRSWRVWSPTKRKCDQWDGKHIAPIVVAIWERLLSWILDVSLCSFSHLGFVLCKYMKFSWLKPRKLVILVVFLKQCGFVWSSSLRLNLIC